MDLSCPIEMLKPLLLMFLVTFFNGKSEKQLPAFSFRTEWTDHFVNHALKQRVAASCSNITTSSEGRDDANISAALLNNRSINIVRRLPSTTTVDGKASVC